MSLELSGSDMLDDPFSDLELGYVRAYWDPNLKTVAFLFLFSESDDLEDAGDHTTLFFTYMAQEFAPSGSETYEPDEPISVFHSFVGQKKERGVLGLERPSFRSKSIMVSWETEGDEVGFGTPISGSYEIQLGADCWLNDGSLTYRGEFSTVLRSVHQREADGCDATSLSGEWDSQQEVGELEVTADSRRLDLDIYRVRYTAEGKFIVSGQSRESDDGSAVQFEVTNAAPGVNDIPIAVLQHDGCGYIAMGGTVELVPEGADFSTGIHTGTFSLQGMGDGEEGCEPSKTFEGTTTFGWCYQ